MVVFFNFAARVFLVGYKTAFDRLRPDDSVLTLICVLGRFDNEIVRDALKDLAYQFWPGDAVGDGTVGVDASVVGGVSVGEAHEAVVLHNADTPRSRTRTPGLCVSGFSRRCRRYRSRGPCACSRWAGKYICRGTPREP